MEVGIVAVVEDVLLIILEVNHMLSSTLIHHNTLTTTKYPNKKVNISSLYLNVNDNFGNYPQSCANLCVVRKMSFV